MTAFTRHILVPSLAPAATVALYFTPVTLIGCAIRGLLSLAVVAISLTAAVATTALGVRVRARAGFYGWWLASTAILLLPALLVLGPLG